MQRLGVSCVVRPIYGSLGAIGLMKLDNLHKRFETNQLGISHIKLRIIRHYLSMMGKTSHQYEYCGKQTRTHTHTVYLPLALEHSDTVGFLVSRLFKEHVVLWE
jgi:hypothetical protein